MSLGVLNNLSAVYAENYLNQTNTSLNTVLQQLSSGSKINSGADDAAGLSLVNGLQANQTALTQSETNAQEGVGLLQVADGALSQVTSLLNRAVTLATEAANGTLNSSQDTAANQEYQSILSEISNIGSTTTYNQEQVFGSVTNIYTGDSSLAGSSVDSLNVRSLSSANVGDTGGVMSYSSGQNNVFLNLSSSTLNASLTDALAGGSTGSTTLTVNYLVPGASGNSTTATAQINVGGSSGYANTVNGLIDAINNSGLGLSATFATQAQAGVQGGGSETGIEISGGLVSAGVAPSASSTSGTLNPSGIAANELLTQGQTVNVSVGGSSVASITINSSVTNLQQLASAINTATNNGGSSTPSEYVTATVVTNGDGTQSLALADSAGTSGALSVTASAGGPIAPVFANGGTGTIGTSTTNLQTVNTANATGTAAVTAADGQVTVGLSNTATEMSLTGSIVLTNAGTGASETFVMGGSGGTDGAHSTGSYDSATNTFTVNGNTLADLRAAINDQDGTHTTADLGITAGAIGGTGAMTLTSATGAVTASSDTLTNTNTLTGSAAAPTATANSDGSLTFALAGVNAADGSDVIMAGSTITITDGANAAVTFTVGGNAANNTATSRAVGSLGANTTMGDLATAIQTYYSGLAGGQNTLTASAGANGLTIDSGTAGTAVSVTASLTNGNATLSLSQPTLGGGSGGAPYATAILGLTDSSGNPLDFSGSLTGSLVIVNNGISDTFVMGTGTNDTSGGAAGGNVIYTGANTVASLETAINDWSSGATDALSLSAADGPDGGIYLQDTSGTASDAITMDSSSTIAVAQTAGTQLSSVTAAAANVGSASSVIIGPANAASTINSLGSTSGTAGTAGYTIGSLSAHSNTDTMTGTLQITPGGATAGTPVDLNLNGQTLAQIAQDSAWAAAGITASLNSTGTSLTFTETAASTVAPAVSIGGSGAITDSAAAVNTSDVLTGAITLTNSNGGSALSETFVMGSGPATSGGGTGTFDSATNTYTVNGNTLGDLQAAINSQTTAGSGSLGLGLVAQATTGGLTVSTNANNGYTVGVSTASGKTNTLVDTTHGTNSSISMGTFATLNDAVSGNFTFTIGSNSPTTIQVNTAGETVQELINQINYGNLAGTGTSGVNGVTASWVAPTEGQNFGSILLTSNTAGTAGDITAASETINDTPTAANLSYTAASAYNTGISGSIGDSITGQSSATFATDVSAHSGIATISYSDGAGQSLNSTNLSSQSEAETALTALNAAIADVAAQDGYIGAQINTLNSVSSVLSTQSENVQSAQNAVQATDYATATSDMSKYEILSQTGIAALAQANSQQQEVLKLLQ